MGSTFRTIEEILGENEVSVTTPEETQSSASERSSSSRRKPKKSNSSKKKVVMTFSFPDGFEKELDDLAVRMYAQGITPKLPSRTYVLQYMVEHFKNKI